MSFDGGLTRDSHWNTRQIRHLLSFLHLPIPEHFQYVFNGSGLSENLDSVDVSQMTEIFNNGHIVIHVDDSPTGMYTIELDDGRVIMRFRKDNIPEAYKTYLKYMEYVISLDGGQTHYVWTARQIKDLLQYLGIPSEFVIQQPE